MRRQHITITYRAPGQTARNWATTAKVIGVLVVLGLIVQYWYIVLALAAIGGACYWYDARRKARLAKHAACLTEIARLERELGLTQ